MSFVNDVLPVVTKVGCNRGACHAATTGKGGFKLSLRGADPLADHRVIVRDWTGQRIHAIHPQQSLFLL